MAKRGIVVEGDPLSSGGKVEKGTGTLLGGKFRAALIGDPTSCPIIGHGAGQIVEGSPNFYLNRKPVALEGHKASCGCALIAKNVGQQMFIDDAKPSSLETYCENFAFNAKFKKFRKLIPYLDLLSVYLDLKCIELDAQKKLSSSPQKSLDSNKLEYIPLDGNKEINCEGNKYIAGPHRKTKQKGMHSHHIPAKSAYLGSEMNPDGKAMDGPAIRMDPKDHQNTSSHGTNGNAGKEYRQKQHELIRQGKLKEAVQMDIDDLRSIAAEEGTPDKYECAIKNYTEHYNSNIAPIADKFIIK